ncbi:MULTISPECIES: hypothetical protein [Sporomusa]|jgi:hypothetical protein|uniref:hypothetical protein n=1 Tax=Sporomusa TaxID=2375 RepID=UPI0016673875|nr:MULTISPECIES: hypothetical protein [Sporomusa]MCM0757711.1 hypothetical protein [Sporomusa sphaeroides DSM 2875]
MLILEARVSFDQQSDSAKSLSYGLSTKNIIRPSINFGNDLLFSGTIVVDKNVDVLISGKTYNVIIEMPTIEQEAYEEIQSLLCVGREFKIQNASKIIGKGTISNFLYE